MSNIVLRDRFGLISPSGDINQNGILWTSYWWAARGGYVDAADMEAVHRCILNGELRRTPESDEYESHDNHLAISYLVKHDMIGLMFGSESANYIKKLLNRNLLISDSNTKKYPTRPWYKRWLYRFPHMPVCLKRSICVEPNWLEKAAFYVSVLWMCYRFKQGDNAALMVLLMLQINPNKRLERYYWKRVRTVHFTLSHCIRDYMQIPEDHFFAQAFKRFDNYGR